MLEQEKNYFILFDENNSLIFAITVREDAEENPVILYDGNEHALFYRSRQETIVLDYIEKSAREVLKNSKTVSVAEIDPDTRKIERQYPVTVKITEKLPAFTLEEGVEKA